MTKQVIVMKTIEEELMDLSVEGGLPQEVEELIDAGCLVLMRARNLLQLNLEQSSTKATSAVI